MLLQKHRAYSPPIRWPRELDMRHFYRIATAAAIALVPMTNALADIAIDFSMRVHDSKPFKESRSFKEGEETTVRIDDTYSVAIVATVTEQGAVSVAARIMKGGEVLGSPRIVARDGQEGRIVSGARDAEGNDVDVIDIQLTPRITAAL